MHVGVAVVVWSGGCGPRRAAKSSGAQPNFVVFACRVGFVLALLWRSMSWNDYSCDSGVVADSHGDVCEVACVEEVWMSRGGTRLSLCGA